MSTVEALGEKATTEHGLGEWLTRAAARLSSVPFALRTPDGVARRFGSGPPAFEVLVHNEGGLGALRSLNELAVAEAYIRGDFDIEGDFVTALSLRDVLSDRRPWLKAWRRIRAASPWTPAVQSGVDCQALRPGEHSVLRDRHRLPHVHAGHLRARRRKPRSRRAAQARLRLPLTRPQSRRHSARRGVRLGRLPAFRRRAGGAWNRHHLIARSTCLREPDDPRQRLLCGSPLPGLLHPRAAADVQCRRHDGGYRRPVGLSQGVPHPSPLPRVGRARVSGLCHFEETLRHVELHHPVCVAGHVPSRGTCRSSSML